MRKRKVLIAALMLMTASLLQMGCGGSSSGFDAKESAPAEAVMEESAYQSSSIATGGTQLMGEPAEEEQVLEEAAEGEGSNTVDEEKTERKLIKTVNLTVETEDYDQLITELEKEIEALGGYIEYKDAYHGDYNSRQNTYRNRHANITARIPAKKLEEFTGAVGEIGNITYESESVEDVTLQYVDLKSHKEMLITEQKRLLELLETAETMEDIIAIESRLSEVRYQIESMESQLRTFDNQVDYSTVHIEVEEVEHYTPQPEKSTWDRIKTGFSENVYRVTSGIKNFAIEFVIAIPVLLVWAIVIVIAIVAGRFIIKKKRERAAKKLAKKQNVLEHVNAENLQNEIEKNL